MRLLTHDVSILATGSAVPERIVTNADLVDGLDTTDAWIQENLGIREAVCSGFVYALALASTTMAAGAADRILVIGADTFSSITDWNDRSCEFFSVPAGSPTSTGSSRINRPGACSTRPTGAGSSVTATSW